MKVWLTIAEYLGTDGEFGSEVYLNKTAQEAGETASSIMADVMLDMDIDINENDPTVVREIGSKTGEWFFRVRIEEEEF